MSEERDLPSPDGDDDVDLGAIDPDGNPLDEIDEAEPEPDEPEPEDQPEPEPEPERRRARVKGEAQRWRERAQTAQAESAELVRRIAALEQQRQQPAFDPQAAQREEQEFRARLEQMLPHEAALEVANRSERRMQAQLAHVALSGFDRSDKEKFDDLAARNRSAARLAQEVERTLAARRAGGDYTLSRTDILDFLVGKELRTRAATQLPRERRAASGRVARETTRPASGRGDVAAGGRSRNQDADDERMLRGLRTTDI